MVIAEGGEIIDDTELSLLVGTLGAAGGAIYTRQPTVIKGTMGRWQINLTAIPISRNSPIPAVTGYPAVAI